MKKLRNDVRNRKETLQKLIENHENGKLARIDFVQIISYHDKPML
jgi:plasmid replication initiation protein